MAARLGRSARTAVVRRSRWAAPLSRVVERSAALAGGRGVSFLSGELASRNGSAGDLLGVGSFMQCRGFHARAPQTSAAQLNQQDFTEMAWEGMVRSVEAARLSEQQVVETEHLMKSLLEQKDGLAPRIFTKVGADSNAIIQATDDFISKQPIVVGNSSRPVMGKCLGSLLAFHSDEKFGQDLLKKFNHGFKELKDGIIAIRGNQRVTDQDPEGKYEALKKFGMILSRRTKITPFMIDEPSVGKTAIAEGLARRIQSELKFNKSELSSRLTRVFGYKDQTRAPVPGLMATRGRATFLLHRISDLPHSRIFAAAFNTAVPLRGRPSTLPFFPRQYRIPKPVLVGINIVPSQTVYIVERDGKYHRTLNSGLHFLNPFTDKIAHVHSLKELLISPRKWAFKTFDGIGVVMFFSLGLKIVDPLLASYKVFHPILETMHIFETKMSSQIRSVTQDKLLEQLDIIFDNVVKDVNADTASWGVECLRVEISELSFFPPKADVDD